MGLPHWGQGKGCFDFGFDVGIELHFGLGLGFGFDHPSRRRTAVKTLMRSSATLQILKKQRELDAHNGTPALLHTSLRGSESTKNESEITGFWKR